MRERVREREFERESSREREFESSREDPQDNKPHVNRGRRKNHSMATRLPFCQERKEATEEREVTQTAAERERDRDR
jgi:hypothetical protein